MLTRRSLIGLAGALAGASSLAAWLGPALSLAGCGDDQNDKAVDRAPVLDTLVTSVMTPALTTMRTTAEALPTALGALSDGPSVTTLAAARTAWSDARSAWRRTSAFAIGPSADLTLSGGILDEPCDGAKIDALAASTTPVDPKTQPATVRGFLALEYLLFDPARDDATMVASFTAPDGAGRAALLKVLAVDLRDKMVAVVDGWQTGGFLEQVRTAGKGSAAFPQQKNAFDALLTQMLVVVDRLIDITRKSASMPGLDPKAPTTDRSDHTLTDLLDDLASTEAMYGSGANSISSIVVEVNAGADQAMLTSLTTARSSLTAFAPPLRNAGADRTPAVDDLILKQRALKSALQTQVYTALGTYTSFTDKDGD